jgi:DNA-directed RNA polymerase specialized sigma24 family protein
VSTHLGDLLNDARRHSFVGRRRELASFDDALAGRSTRRVLFLHGQGGIGKTTLLQELRVRAQAAGRGVVQLDGRDTDPSPDGMRAAVRRAPGRHHADDPGALIPAGVVLLVDGYEQLAPIDGWLRDGIIPALRTDNVVVLAGLDPPGRPWRTDPGWRQLVAVHRLDLFEPAESVELLAHAGVAPHLRQHLLGLGRGHPLTMALLADLAASDEVPDALADAPDLVAALLESFVREAPSAAHLTGLAACAIAWLTTEDLLVHLVGAADAPEVWRWLTRLPFMTSGPHGLFTHDLARDVLDAEFERRAPERYWAYRQAVFVHAVANLRTATSADRPLHSQQLLFLRRDTHRTGIVSDLRARGSVLVVPARADEHDEVCSIIERFEGPASAGLARAWLAERPGPLKVVRTADGVAGYAYHITCPGGSGLEDGDPVVRAVLDHVARHGPTRPGEHIHIGRFFGGARTHQRDPYAYLAGPVTGVAEWLTRPFAWSVVIIVDTDHWAPHFDDVAFTELFELEVGTVRHVAYGIDWRRVPVDTWLDLLRIRGRSGESGPPPTALVRPPPPDRARFGAAVKAALQTLHRPDRLAANPLMGSALAAGPAGRSTDQLRATIEDAVASLAAQPKGDRLRAVLNRTYLRPAPTQEAAAEVLGLPLSTYRRHLARALDHLVDLLWTVETGGVRLPAPSPGADQAGRHPI